MEDRSSGYCSSPAALLSVSNVFLGFFPLSLGRGRSALAPRCPLQPSPALPLPVVRPLSAPLPNGPSKLTPPVGSGPGKRVPTKGWDPQPCGVLAACGAGTRDAQGETVMGKERGKKQSLGPSVTRVDAQGGQPDNMQGVIALFLFFFSITAFTICLFPVLNDSPSSFPVGFFFPQSPHGWDYLCLCPPPSLLSSLSSSSVHRG